MQNLEERDYFSDHEILKDPYAYFEAVRAKGPIYQLPESGIVVVTGFDEALEVLKNTEDFSSVLAPQGPAAALPFQPQGSDITPQIEAHRTEFVGGDLLVSLDDRPHAFSRALIGGLFTPSRLKANEAFIAEFSDELVRGAVAKGGCDLIKEIATPFVTLVIADLLGVPADDRQLFMDAIEAGPPPGSLDANDLIAQNQPLVLMGGYFVGYVHDRRENPRDDVLSELANAKYPDGSTPDALEIVRLATFLFGAGQDTSAKLLGNAMKFIVDQPGLQDQLRADPKLIAPLLEEVLRVEGSTKMTARIARKDSRIGHLETPAGTKVMIALAAANRDPRRWEDPQAFTLNRPRIKEHLAFGRGAHVCAGAPLARVEVRLILEKFLEHTSNIELVEEKHGPPGARTLEFEPSFIIRGLGNLHLKLTPAAGFKPPEPAKADKPKRGLFGLFGKKDDKAAAPKPYSTGETRLGVLLADPAATAVLDRHFPGVSTDPRIGMGKGMTLRMVQKFAPEMFTNEALDAIDAELAKLPVKH
ncbi:cytochrome P450 [Caulobacter soli]|uniref:cytochrome P450 n=1 Tax=Caulobacter soli TaxID=2708539 RepID=UPI0013EDCA46|nr:cytochrome P450 [Caulobacter soli]